MSIIRRKARTAGLEALLKCQRCLQSYSLWTPRGITTLKLLTVVKWILWIAQQERGRGPLEIVAPPVHISLCLAPLRAWNRPFPSCPRSLFQFESKCLVLISMWMKTVSHSENFARRLVLKWRLDWTPIWPISSCPLLYVRCERHTIELRILSSFQFWSFRVWGQRGDNSSGRSSHYRKLSYQDC